MESNLNIKKREDGSVVLFDETVYQTEEEIMKLYNTFKAVHLDKITTKAKMEQGLVTLGDELVMLERRFEQLKKFFDDNDIKYDDTDVQLVDQQ